MDIDGRDGREVIVEHDLHNAADEHGEDGNIHPPVGLQNGVCDEHQADEDARDAEHREQLPAERTVVAGIKETENRAAERPQAKPHREGEQRRDAEGRAHDARGLLFVVLRDGGGDCRNDRGRERDHQRRGQVVEIHAGRIVAVERAGLIERVAQRVLKLSLHERGVDQRDDGHHRRGDGDGNGQRQQAAHDRAARRAALAALQGGTVAQIVSRHVDERENGADGHAADGACRGDVVRLTDLQKPQRERETEDELAQCLQDLRDGRGRHILPALRVAAEGGQAPHAHHRGRERADAVGRARVVEKGGKIVVAPPHQRKRDEPQHQKNGQREVEGALRLPRAAARVGLAHKLGERDGETRGRDGQHCRVDVVGVGKVCASALAENVAQRNLKHRADDLDGHDAECQHRCAAKKRLLFFGSHRKYDLLFQRVAKPYSRSRQPRIREEKCGADCSAISLTSSPESGWGRTPAAMLAQSVTPRIS